MPTEDRPGVRPEVLALAGWVLLAGIAVAIGQVLLAQGVRMKVLAPPLFGKLDPRLPVQVVLPVVVASVVVWWGPRAAERLSWRALLVTATLVTAGWAVSLALVDGPSGLTAPLNKPSEYLRDLGRVGHPVDFLRGFVANIDSYRTHVRSHPPGMVLLLWAMRRIGLGGPGWAAVLVVAGGALTVPAALLALGAVAGRDRARAAAPFLVLAPTAIWVASSADALFAGVATWAVALVCWAAVGNERRRTTVAAVAGGVLAGCAATLSYGVVLAGLPALAVVVWRRSWRTALIGAGAAVAVLAVLAAVGFWWQDGLAATRVQYAQSVARDRPYAYFVLANLAAFAIVVGPATAAGLTRLRDRQAWLLVGGGLAAVLIADVSGLSKAEVERIWLPFAPWCLLACAGLRDRVRLWLAGQAVTALLVQALVRTGW